MSDFEMKTLYSLPMNTVSPLKESGTFRGYASTTTLDKSQDIIEPGAFSKTLQYWQKRKNAYPNICAEHDRDHFIGTCTKLYEDHKGLYMEGKLFIEYIPKAQEVYDALISGKKRGLSIGFYVKKSSTEGRVRRIQQLDLVEISIVSHPCNQEAHIHEFKRDHDPTHDNTLAQIRRLIACFNTRN